MILATLYVVLVRRSAQIHTMFVGTPPVPPELSVLDRLIFSRVSLNIKDVTLKKFVNKDVAESQKYMCAVASQYLTEG